MSTSETYTVTIDKLVHQGRGLAEIEGYKVFVPDTLPGDRVEIELVRQKKHYGEGRVLRYLEESSLRDTSACPHFSEGCGGCQFIDVPYDKQLSLKQEMLEDSFRSFFREGLETLAPLLPSPRHSFYRNKMSYSFAYAGKEVLLGLKKRASHHIISTPACRLQSENAQQIIKSFLQLLNDPRENYPAALKRQLDQLVIRESRTENRILVNLFCQGKTHPETAALLEKVQALNPTVSALYQTSSFQPSTPRKSGKKHKATRRNRVHRKQETVHIGGETILREKIGGLEFQISPRAFFQTNSSQTEILIKTIQDLVATDRAPKIILDLYCGTGSLALSLADQAELVIGVDNSRDSVEDAKNNSRLNGIGNTRFHCEDSQHYLQHIEEKPDLIILDPPRSGLSRMSLEELLRIKAPALIYVSCDPATLCRDLSGLTKGGYKTESIQPLDMFPNTFHIENVCSLRRT